MSGLAGNQLYFTTTSEWRDVSTSIGTVLYLLRRPMGMNWDRMKQAKMIWPLSSDEPSPVTVVFLLLFTCVTIWIMANLYRAVIIQEYASVVQTYMNQPPADLTDDPWPSLNPMVWWGRAMHWRNDRAYRKRVDRHQKDEWRSKLEETCTALSVASPCVSLSKSETSASHATARPSASAELAIGTTAWMSSSRWLKS